MTWTRACERDRELPARAGEPDLAPLPEEDLLALVRARLLRKESPPPVSARWEFARWKPGVSITTGFTLAWDDGHEQRVVLKRYADGKDREIERSYTPDERTRRREDRLDSFAAAPSLALCLYTFPADRMLPGAARLLHLHRTARLLNSIPLDPARRVRGSRSGAVLLRYKPERRAVFRLDLALEGAGVDGSRERLAARALPPVHASRVLAARAASIERSPLAIGPRLVAAEERTGILIEQWLDVDVPGSAEFGHAFEAGRLVAQLHALPFVAPARAEASSIESLFPLFAVEAELSRRARALRFPPPRNASAWIHGDLHPDQVVREREGGAARLLDLDSLAPGHPSEDLATWVADHVAADPTLAFRSAARPLVEGYRAAGGTPPLEEDLLPCTGFALVRLAAAGIRRLERGAVSRAARLLAQAEELLSVRGVRP